MKILLPLILALCVSLPAFAAGFENTGEGQKTGFKGPVSGSQATTVTEALSLPDNARVTLTGNIIAKLAGSKDEYVFKDGSGEIQVEIDDKVFRKLGMEVTPETMVRISGKMDKDFAKQPEIEVKFLEIVN